MYGWSRIRVLVAGGAGFIGSNLVDKLVGEGYRVVVFDDLSSGRIENIRHYLDDPLFRFVRGSVTDRQAVLEAVRGVDAVVNLAGKGNLAKSVEDPVGYHEVNATGTLNLLEACVRAGVGKFVFTSSGSVYPSEVLGPIREETPYDPISPYAASKVCAEVYCRTFRRVYGISTVVLRLFNVYGPRRENSSYGGAVTNFMVKTMRGEEVEVYGDGSDVRDYVYVADVVKAILLGLERDVSGEFNVGTGVGTTTNRLLELVGRVVGKNPKAVYRPKRQGDSPSRVADLTKSRRELGYSPDYDLQAGLVQLKKYLEGVLNDL